MNEPTLLDPLDLLICAAVPAELRAFGARLGLEPTPFEVGEIRVGRSAGRAVGLLAAGIGRQGDGAVEEALSGSRPAAVVNVGVAGSLDPELTAGTVVLVESWHAPRPPHEEVARADPGLRDHLAARLTAAGVHHRRGAASTVDEPLHDPGRRDRLHAATGALVVEMEGAAWAGLAAAAGVPFAGLRVVSDHADADLPEEALRLMDRDRFLTPEGEIRPGPGTSWEKAPGQERGPGQDQERGQEREPDHERAPDQEQAPDQERGAEKGWDEEKEAPDRLRRAGRKWAAAQEALAAAAAALLPGS